MNGPRRRLRAAGWFAAAGLAALAARAAEPGLPAPAAFIGMCDASAAVALDAHHFAVADDEGNVIRIYRREGGGVALSGTDFSALLQVDGEKPEADMEGATWLGERIFWITSHGRNRDGKFRASRHRFFATRVERSGEGLHLKMEGRPYVGLQSDLLRSRSLRSFELLEGSQRAPKERGGFNIEALCAGPDGRLWIGFRNPIPRGKALLVPLMNAEGLLRGQSALFGEPELLELQGLGVRDMIYAEDGYLIIGGSFDGLGRSRLFRWDGPGRPAEELPVASLADINPEAMIRFSDRRAQLMFLSDDGTLAIDGVDCKTLADPNRKRFRSRWIALPGRGK